MPAPGSEGARDEGEGVNIIEMVKWGLCCKVSDNAAFCIMERSYILKNSAYQTYRSQRITVRTNWRITFEFIDDDAYILNLEDYH